MKNIKFFLLSLIAVTLLFSACSDLSKDTSGNQEKSQYTVLGSLSLAGVSRAVYSRTATTAFSDEPVWTISAIKGEKSYLPNAVSGLSFNFTFDEAGEYLIEATALKEGKIIAQGSCLCMVSADKENFASIIAKPVASILPGSVNLEINLDSYSANKVSSVQVEWLGFVNIDRTKQALGYPSGAELTGDAKEPEISEEVQAAIAALIDWEEQRSEGEFNKTLPVESGKAVIEMDKIFCGAHTVKLSFSDSVGNTLYSCKEILNVYSGFTTNEWYGTAPYLNNGTFTLTSTLVEKYGTDRVPSTDYMLYDYNSSESEFDYYFMDDYTKSLPATATLTSSYNSIGFDSDGYYYILSKILGSATYIKSNKPDFGSETVSNTVDSGAMYLYGNMGQDLLVDRKTGFLYIMDTSYVCITQITNDDGEYIFNNGLGAYDSAKSYSFDDSAGNSDPNKNIIRDAEAFAVYNGVAYFASAEHDKLIIADLKDAIRQDGANSYAYISSKSVSLGLNDMNLSSDAKITDMIYQNGAVYMLLNEKHDDFWQDFTYYCRGAVLRYDCLTKEVTSLGWTSDAIDISDKKFYVYNSTSNDGPIVYLKENPDSIENEDSRNAYIADRANWVTIDDTVSSGDDLYPYPALYAPYSTMIDNAFYGPKKFIAIKPKKLVIADEGYCFYTDSNDAFCFKNVNRVVTVDLESFAISSVEDVSVTFETDASGYLNSSGYTDVSALNLSNCIYSTQGYEYQTTDEDPVKLTIPLDED